MFLFSFLVSLCSLLFSVSWKLNRVWPEKERKERKKKKLNLRILFLFPGSGLKQRSFSVNRIFLRQSSSDYPHRSVSMAAATDTASPQESIGGKRTNILVTAGNGTTTDVEQSKNTVRLEELYSFGSDNMPKVRKPYTITKQREKWTEEEHQRFLEALRLYGRGWQKIQEHVGTKTAVQIRSHAQKFFSKVAQESNGGSENSVQPIEIPPPRPKRKPMRPYPRKSVEVLWGSSVSNQSERSLSPHSVVSEKESLSPTSVLTATASDAASALSEQRDGYPSPPSCTPDMHSSSLLPIEKQNKHSTASPSTKEEKRTSSSVQLSSGPVLEKLLSTKFELTSNDAVSCKGDSNAAARSGSIRLFGKTVLVTDRLNPAPAETDPFLSDIWKASPVYLNVDKEKQDHTLPQNLGTVDDEGNLSTSSTPIYPRMELQGESSNLSENNPSLPYQVFCQGLPFLRVSSCGEASQNNSSPIYVDERLEEQEIPHERSCNYSNALSINKLENRERNQYFVDSQCQQPSVERSSLQMRSKGFLPYKRCLKERDSQSAGLVIDARERQRARVCS